MLTKQMITAQFGRRYIPYPHNTLFSLMTFVVSKIFTNSYQFQNNEVCFEIPSVLGGSPFLATHPR